jgi:hypothetical protein
MGNEFTFTVKGPSEEFEKSAKDIEKARDLVCAGGLDWLTRSSPNYSGPQGDLEFVFDLSGKPKGDTPRLQVYPISGDIRIEPGSEFVSKPYTLVSTNSECASFRFEGIPVDFFYHPKESISKH